MSKKKKTTNRRRTKSDYINNAKMLDAIKEWKCNITPEEKHPPMPNYLGECFLDIAKGLAKKPNFSGYTFKDDMIADAVENCIRYAGNFDPEKSSNPFAYFTQLAYCTFLRMIEKEKKYAHTKFSMTRTVIEKKLLGGKSIDSDLFRQLKESMNRHADDEKNWKFLQKKK
jgi:hypothetical protein